MRAFAINSSPNMENGNTAVILSPFLDGMREAGAEVELFYTKELKIKPCQGELHCWFKEPGRCIHKDDMEWVLPKLSQADIFVVATPLYVDGMSGPMKSFFDRIVPVAQPFIELRDGHCRHPARHQTREDGKLVLVSNCGFWEIDNFDALINHMEAICRNLHVEFAGALLRPHGPFLKPMIEMGAPVNDILEAAKEAGRELVREGEMSSETLKIVSRELMPQEVYVDMANKRIQELLNEVERKRASS